MGLIGAVSPVFNLFANLYSVLPNAVRLLLVGSFGLALLLGVANLFKG